MIKYKNTILRIRNRISFLYQERVRIENLKAIERCLLLSDFHIIAGIDEVGRGAIAGPVVAAAVVIKDIDSFFISDLKDSKKLSRAKRKALSKLITKKSFDIGIGLVNPCTIDRINIVKATLLAMRRSIWALKKIPDYLLIDALTIPFIKINQNNLVKGEDKSISIAAASIIAKVYRDNLMELFHKEYPLYNFNQNMGYGTKKHLEAIKNNGISPIHRKTFGGIASL